MEDLVSRELDGSRIQHSLVSVIDYFPTTITNTVLRRLAHLMTEILICVEGILGNYKGSHMERRLTQTVVQ